MQPDLNAAITQLQHGIEALDLSASNGADMQTYLSVSRFPSNDALASFQFYTTQILDGYEERMKQDATLKYIDISVLREALRGILISHATPCQRDDVDEAPHALTFHLRHPVPPNPENKRLSLAQYGMRFFIVEKGRRPGIYYKKYVLLTDIYSRE